MLNELIIMDNNNNNNINREICDNKEIIYKGIFDNRLNTDNSWIETIIIECNINSQLKNIKLNNYNINYKNLEWIEIESIINENEKYNLKKSLEKFVLLVEEKRKICIFNVMLMLGVNVNGAEFG